MPILLPFANSSVTGEVKAKRSGKGVVMWTDRPAMTIAVD